MMSSGPSAPSRLGLGGRIYAQTMTTAVLSRTTTHIRIADEFAAAASADHVNRAVRQLAQNLGGVPAVEPQIPVVEIRRHSYALPQHRHAVSASAGSPSRSASRNAAWLKPSVAARLSHAFCSAGGSAATAR